MGIYLPSGDDSLGGDESQAADVIAGFRYQILHSVVALLDLGSDEELLLEVSEDFSITSGAHGQVDVQVKNSQALAGPPNYSLKSDSVRLFIKRFWSASAGLGQGSRRAIFLARGGVAKERDFAFPGKVAGIEYWRAASLDADTAPIRDALKILFADHEIGRWLDTSPSDTELRSRLLRRVSWELQQRDATAIAREVSERLRAIYAKRGLPVVAADSAVGNLVTRVLEAASDRDSDRRKLTPTDLQYEVEKVAGAALVLERSAGRTVRARPEEGLLVSRLEEAEFALAQRGPTVERIFEAGRGKALMWLTGSHGTGKSALARLVARRIGGRWVVLDLWPLRSDEVAALAAFRDLAAVAIEEEVDGVVVDDFDPSASTVLESRLPILVQELERRGAKVIVTSHERPAPHMLDGKGVPVEPVMAPYFDEDDLAELVGMAPAPEAAFTASWAKAVRMTTGGGHPLLAAAKVASLRARGWPKAAFAEDLTVPGDTLQVTRERARRELLQSLSELDANRSFDAGQLLRRISGVFDRVDDALAFKLAALDPPLRTAGDALAVLKGSWLEILPRGDFRVSPLLTNLHADMPPQDIKRARRLAAQHWMGKGRLTERTLPLCFWNAMFGEHDFVLMKLSETMQSMQREQLNVAAPMLSPLIVFATDRSIYTGDRIAGVYVRLLQFVVADVMGEADIALKAARRLQVELDELDEGPRSLLTTTAAMRVTMSATPLTAEVRIEFALRLRAAFPIATKYSEGELVERRDLLPPSFGPELDLADFLFTPIVGQLRSTEQTIELAETLSALPLETRNRFLDAAGIMFQGQSVMVNAGWAADQIAERDATACLASYERLQGIVDLWSREDVAIEVAIARSVILDEWLDRKPEALALVEIELDRHGAKSALLQQKSKVLGHLGRYAEASDIALALEGSMGSESPLDRYIHLRAGAVSSAEAGRYADAIRLFGRARDEFPKDAGRDTLRTAMLVERSLTEWRCGRKAEAVLRVAEALEELEGFEPQASKQAERTHQFARGLVGIFSQELTSDVAMKDPPFSFGAASLLELTDEKLMGGELKLLSDTWRVLAAVEAALGVDLGIDQRSLAKRDGPPSLVAETFVRSCRYSCAVRAGDVAGAIRTGQTLVDMERVTGLATADAAGMLRVDPEALVRPDVPLTDRECDAMQSVLLDLFAWRASASGIAPDFLSEMTRSVDEALGPTAMKSLLDATSPSFVLVPSVDRKVFFAHCIATPSEVVAVDPDARFQRDFALLLHIATSGIRRHLEEAVGRSILNGWELVLRDQTFRLQSPGQHISAMRNALMTEGGAFRAAVATIGAARNAVRHRFGSGWFEILDGLAASGG